MRQYSTAKRRALTDFLKEHSDKQFSVEEITDALMDTGISRKDAIKQTAKELDLPKNVVYDAALNIDE